MSQRLAQAAQAEAEGYRPDTTTPATVLLDPSSPPSDEVPRDDEAHELWRGLADLFSSDDWFRSPETVRAALCSGLAERLPPLDEAPTADEMRRLRVEVLGAGEGWLARALRQPLGTVRMLEAGVITPTPEVVHDPPEFTWEHFLGLWSLLYVYEQVSGGRS